MTPSARVQAAIELWEKIWDAGVPMDTICGDYFRVRRYIGGSDRQAVAARVYGMMRSYARAGWWLARAGAADTPRNRAIALLALEESLAHPHVRDLFSGARHAPAPLTPEEDALSGALCGQSLDHPEMPEAVRGECPPECYEGLRRIFGDNFMTEMTAMLTPAPLDIRVNTIKSTREDARKALAGCGIEASLTPFSPVGLRLPERVHLAGTKLPQRGVIEIQDEGSQLIALLCAAQPGMQVLDACAGGGGKTLALAAGMQGRGRVVAMDSDAGRLARGKPRYTRAGIHNVEIRPLEDERNRKWLRRQKEAFDVVLIDAPCTSSGTWRRNPDLRWRRHGPTQAEIMAAQTEILDRFAPCVKPGGRLVYATCSLFREENEDQIVAFLGRHPDFELLPIDRAWTDAALGKQCPYQGDVMRLSPALSGTDGFFAAVLTRKS